MTKSEEKTQRFQHTKEMAERVKNAAQRILDGEPESVACRKEDIDLNWFRRFSRGEISRNRERGRVTVNKSKWCSWEDAFLSDLCGGDVYCPDNFCELFERCIKEALSERQQAIFRMRYLEEKNYEEIGAAYGLTRERVRQIIVRGLRRLRVPKYRFPLMYGENYEEAIQDLNSAQAEYDKQYLESRDKFIREANEKIEEVKKKAAALRAASIRIENQLRAASIRIEDQKYLMDPDILDPETLAIIPLSDMDLSARSYNALTRMCKIQTVGQLSRMTHKDLLAVRNLGKRSAEEIKNTLYEKYGITLAKER